MQGIEGDDIMTTWKKFKEVVESRGVTDDMEIDYIDLDSSPIMVTVTGNSFHVL